MAGRHGGIELCITSGQTRTAGAGKALVMEPRLGQKAEPFEDRTTAELLSVADQ